MPMSFSRGRFVSSSWPTKRGTAGAAISRMAKRPATRRSIAQGRRAYGKGQQDDRQEARKARRDKARRSSVRSGSARPQKSPRTSTTNLPKIRLSAKVCFGSLAEGSREGQLAAPLRHRVLHTRTRTLAPLQPLAEATLIGGRGWKTGRLSWAVSGSAPKPTRRDLAVGGFDAKQLVPSVPTWATPACSGDRNLRRPHLY